MSEKKPVTVGISNLFETISSLESEIARLKEENLKLKELSIQHLDSYSKELFTQINAKNEEIERLKSSEGVREDMKCKCTPDETTGWIQTKCCNICGKHVVNKE